MHYGIFTYGSRGDVQPYIALACGLMEKGHQVTLAAPENFKSLIEQYQVTFLPLAINVEELIQSPKLGRVLRTGNDIAFLRQLYGTFHNQRDELFDGILQLAEKTDLVIVNFIVATIANVATEYFNKKLLIIQLNPPLIPTRTAPLPGAEIINQPLYNRLTYTVFYKILWLLAKKDLREFRRRLKLPQANSSAFYKLFENQIPILHAYSSTLIDRLADWEQHHVITGFLHLENQITDNAPQYYGTTELNNWLKAGEKPLYFGFGSIPIPYPERFCKLLNDILTHTSYRIIFCEGWSKIPNLPVHPNLFVLAQTNHQWLLPQCRAAVIHGGIGTLSAVLRAGIPVLVASIFVDQPIWGNIIARKKLGAHIPCRKLNFKRFLNALDILMSDEVVANVAAVSKILNEEDGMERTIEYIEGFS